ncbi:MAG: dTMP kinase [Polyangiaceae bacterium]|nr:dTMP kinase [Polyangiaceae bacterium]
MRNSSNAGHFVVLEGIDGAGTTTQTQKLVERLRREREGVAMVRATREPSDGPIGALIRQVLSGRIVNPSWTTMALLFAADRMDHVEAEIKPVLAQGGVVVSDRYDASSIAYQSVSSANEADKADEASAAIDWIRELNRHALRPGLTIVLDLPAELAARRRQARGHAPDLYEQPDTQRALAVFYRDLARHMPADRVVVIDGSGSIDEVHELVLGAYRAGLT